jgi:hypothetical protein
MTLSSFVRELYRSASLSKVISWDTLYLVFKDRFLLQPKPELDARASFWLPSGDVCRLKETVTLPQVTNLVKRASQLF